MPKEDYKYMVTSGDYTIAFRSRAEKDHYVEKEVKYTRNFYTGCMTAFGKKANEEAKKALDAERIKFAKMMGYVPEHKNSYVWVFDNSVNDDDKQLA